MVVVLVDFMFKKSDMTIHLGLFNLAAFIQVAIPTLFVSTTTYISMHNVFECMITYETKGTRPRKINASILSMYTQCVERLDCVYTVALTPVSSAAQAYNSTPITQSSTESMPQSIVLLPCWNFTPVIKALLR
jgi:hypothetical protein